MISNPFLYMSLIAFLMFLDYYLTIYNFKLYNLVYKKFFEIESYELNPILIESINKKQYNFKHLISVVFVCLMVYLFYFLSRIGRFGFTFGSYQLMVGLLISIMLYINSRHIQNWIIFNGIKKDAKMISGKVKISYANSILTLKAQSISLFIVLLIAFIISPSWFLFGFMLGPLSVLIKTQNWKKNFSKLKEKKTG